MEKEFAIELATSRIRFGPGVTREIGMDLAALGAKRVAVFTDPYIVKLGPVATVLQALDEQKIPYQLFDRVRVEPTDESFQQAIDFAKAGEFDAYVAVGGGSTMDTAKAANLYATYPAPRLDYVNPPIGLGKPVPGPLKPMIAVPTTAGTGSETTGVAIFHFVEMHAKTGIANRWLKPTLGLLDPDNTKTLPPEVAASTALDVLSHAIESYTAVPYTARPRPESPVMRPAYQGSNPISDIWSMEALRMVKRYMVRAVEHPDDDEARGWMLLAAAYAGIGFGNSGVHLPHGMSYPVSGMLKTFHAKGYPGDGPLVPHGMSVILNAPAVFRFTAPACPERHLTAAEALGADISGKKAADAGKILSETIIGLMQRLNVPDGLSAIGYGSEHIPALVEGTLPQHRVTKLSPKPAGPEELAGLFEDAMRYY
jgi:hydroxyacid-oxoacid transhydrogenase